MLPTKNNFKGRWGTESSFSHEVGSDTHLFSCVRYSDLRLSHENSEIGIRETH